MKFIVSIAVITLLSVIIYTLIQGDNSEHLKITPLHNKEYISKKIPAVIPEKREIAKLHSSLMKPVSDQATKSENYDLERELEELRKEKLALKKEIENLKSNKLSFGKQLEGAKSSIKSVQDFNFNPVTPPTIAEIAKELDLTDYEIEQLEEYEREYQNILRKNFINILSSNGNDTEKKTGINFLDVEEAYNQKVKDLLGEDKYKAYEKKNIHNVFKTGKGTIITNSQIQLRQQDK